MSELRRKRLEQAILEAVNSILIKNISDPRIGFVTITDVSVSKDNKTATVHYSVVGSQKKIEQSKTGISSATKLIARMVTEKLKIAIMPSLRFAYDETPSKAQKLEMFFQEIENEQIGQGSSGQGTEGNEEGGDIHS